MLAVHEVILKLLAFGKIYCHFFFYCVVANIVANINNATTTVYFPEHHLGKNPNHEIFINKLMPLIY
jgi:hypothetical protein